jgi:hypothetical protein
VKSAGILAVQSRIERSWLYGVDLQSELVFDLDERRVLANFDLHLPKPRWKREKCGNASLTVKAGDLAFTPETIEAKSFYHPVTVRVDPLTRLVRIDFSTYGPNRAVALSECCLALLLADHLVGFEVRNLASVF